MAAAIEQHLEFCEKQASLRTFLKRALACTDSFRSLLNLNVWMRCGFKPCGRQMRRTLISLMPAAPAIARVDLCVRFGGFCRVVFSMAVSTASKVFLGVRPGLLRYKSKLFLLTTVAWCWR